MSGACLVVTTYGRSGRSVDLHTAHALKRVTPHPCLFLALLLGAFPVALLFLIMRHCKCMADPQLALKAPCGSRTAGETSVASQPRSRRALGRSSYALLLLLRLRLLLLLRLRLLLQLQLLWLWLLRRREPRNQLPQSMLLLHS